MSITPTHTHTYARTHARAQMSDGESPCCFQLSNEMQLSIMNKVKSGELSIEDALAQARMGAGQTQPQGQAEEVRTP